MMKSATYRIELWSADGSTAPTEIAVKSAEEVQAFVAHSFLPDTVLYVTHSTGRVDCGNFVIFLNPAKLAYVRLLEHRGFHAARPDATPTGHTVRFMDDGISFDVDEAFAIPAATAITALHHWLATGEPYPGVPWQDE